MLSQERPWWPCPGGAERPGPAHRGARCIHTSWGGSLPAASVRLAGPRLRSAASTSPGAAARCLEGMLEVAEPRRGGWPGAKGGAGGREGASRCFSGRHPLGHPAQPRTTRKRIFQPPALGTHLSESNESGCRWRLRDSSVVVKGSWGFSPSSVSTWAGYV